MQQHQVGLASLAAGGGTRTLLDMPLLVRKDDPLRAAGAQRRLGTAPSHERNLTMVVMSVCQDRPRFRLETGSPMPLQLAMLPASLQSAS